MSAFRKNISSFLLLVIGICWGNLWITEIFSLPEWWFIGVSALLFGAGYAVARFIPESYRLFIPSLLAMPILLMQESDCRTILMLFCFGAWYCGCDILNSNWRSSRNFCGGLLIGGTLIGGLLANFMTCPEYLYIWTSGVMLIYSGLQTSFLHALEVSFIPLFLMWFYPEENHFDKNILPPDTGTVISAFALTADPPAGDLTTAIIISGNTDSNRQYIRVLGLACKLRIFPNLPGTIPTDTDMIFAVELPETGDGGTGAMLRSLKNDGVLIIPTDKCSLLPGFQWFLLPGSDGRYAICSPERELQFSPAQMDLTLEKRFSHLPKGHAPTAGVLDALLTSRKYSAVPVIMPTNADHYIIHYLCCGGAALLIILSSIIINNRCETERMDTMRIFINTFGMSLLTAAVLPQIFAGLPAITCLRGLLAAICMMWFFRKPVPTKKHDSSYVRFCGLTALVFIGVTFLSGFWIDSITTLIASGFAFSVLDGELCSKRQGCVEDIRFAGIAAGAFTYFLMQNLHDTYLSALILAAVLRFWSWFRS